MPKRELASAYPSALFRFAIALKEARQLTWSGVASQLHIPNPKSFATLARRFKKGEYSTDQGDRMYDDFFVIMAMFREGKTLQEMCTRTDRDMTGLHRALAKWGLTRARRLAIMRGELETPPVSILWSGRRN